MRYHALLVASGLALAACTSQQAATTSAQSQLSESRDKLVADLAQCTQQYGYDPNAISGIAENALAPNELQWRQCAYDAVRNHEKANPAMASRYEQLIAEDISMTTAIQNGTMTRSQRRARLNELIAQTKAAEEQQVAAAQADQDRQREQVHAVYQSVQGMAF
jgi:ABC-type enterochelin transport system substrate-binding protein